MLSGTDALNRHVLIATIFRGNVLQCMYITGLLGNGLVVTHTDGYHILISTSTAVWSVEL